MIISNIMKVSNLILMVGAVYALDNEGDRDFRRSMGEPSPTWIKNSDFENFESTIKKTRSFSDGNMAPKIQPNTNTSTPASLLSMMFGEYYNNSNPPAPPSIFPSSESPRKRRIRDIKIAANSDNPNDLSNILKKTSITALSNKDYDEILSNSPPNKKGEIEKMQTIYTYAMSGS